MARFYTDEDFSFRVVELLRAAGHDVLTANVSGLRVASDGEHLLKASELQRILLTYNLKDFRTLNIAWRAWPDAWAVRPQPVHMGIVVPRQKPLMSDEEAAGEVAALVNSAAAPHNALFWWGRLNGWRRDT